MVVLGLNFLHGDSAACLIVNGKLVSASEEERFLRIKHCSEFPLQSIDFCLKSNNLNIQDIDYIAINYNFRYNFFDRLFFLLKNFFLFNFISRRSDIVFGKIKIKKKLELFYKTKLRAKFVFVPHHLAHAYSTLFFLEKKNSIIFSFDGSGDFSTIEAYLSDGEKLKLVKKNIFPHSLGLLYTAFTQFIGFLEYGDEYKFMGLAAYGKPIYYDDVKKMIISQDPFRLDMSYFNFPSIDYSNKKPYLNIIYSEKFYNFFTKKYKLIEIDYNSQFSKDIASSVQSVFQDTLLLNLRNIKKKYNSSSLYLTGGCALNSLSTGKIIESKIFKIVSVGPNPGDAGGAVGAAFYALAKENLHIEPQQHDKFIGPSFSNGEIKKNIIDKILNKNDYIVNLFENFEDVSKKTAYLIKSNSLVFWFQDRMEWGPRALGNRSILADPTKKDIKEFINKAIKKRELYRPFAVSIMESFADNYFHMEGNLSPNMNIVFRSKEETVQKFPEVVHFDNTSRLQTVSEKDNKKFYRLIRDFYDLTKCPMLINTSLNIDTPIAMSPEHAWNFFIQTEVSSLVLGNWLIQKKYN